MITPKDFTLPFVKKEQIAKDAWMFSFDRSEERGFTFLPGQYIRMTLDLPLPDERGNGRFFSITSSPLDSHFLSIATRISQSVFKKTLINLSLGTQVKFFGPTGKFILNEEEKRPLIFLAGGIGITPFRSMIIYAAEKNLSLPITLFASFSVVEEMVFYKELTEISTDHQNLKVIYTITKLEQILSSWEANQIQNRNESPQGTKENFTFQARVREKWSGETGRINADMIEKYCPDFMDSVFYISGPPAMVDAMQSIVKDMGVADEQVKLEKFMGY
jgi:ferredoxin-NADP reductase